LIGRNYDVDAITWTKKHAD